MSDTQEFQAAADLLGITLPKVPALGTRAEQELALQEWHDGPLKRAWRKLAREHHPDANTNASPAEKAAAEEKFKAASAAYELLSRIQLPPLRSFRPGGPVWDEGTPGWDDYEDDDGDYGEGTPDEDEDDLLGGQARRQERPQPRRTYTRVHPMPRKPKTPPAPAPAATEIRFGPLNFSVPQGVMDQLGRVKDRFEERLAQRLADKAGKVAEDGFSDAAVDQLADEVLDAFLGLGKKPKRTRKRVSRKRTTTIG